MMRKSNSIGKQTLNRRHKYNSEIHMICLEGNIPEQLLGTLLEKWLVVLPIVCCRVLTDV